MFKCHHILLIRCHLKSATIFSLMHCAPFQKKKTKTRKQINKQTATNITNHGPSLPGSTDPRLSYVALVCSSEEIDEF